MDRGKFHINHIISRGKMFDAELHIYDNVMFISDHRGYEIQLSRHDIMMLMRLLKHEALMEAMDAWEASLDRDE